MRRLLLIIPLLITSTVYADDYDLLDDNANGAVPVVVEDAKKDEDLKKVQEEADKKIEEIKEEAKEKIIKIQKEADESSELIIKISEEKYEQLEYWYNIWQYLFGATGLTISGFLLRLGYLFYKTKTGQILVKHLKNDAMDLEEDIIENIIKITDLETGEDLRQRLRNVQLKLLEIAEEKLPPKPPI